MFKSSWLWGNRALKVSLGGVPRLRYLQHFVFLCVIVRVSFPCACFVPVSFRVYFLSSFVFSQFLFLSFCVWHLVRVCLLGRLFFKLCLLFLVFSGFFFFFYRARVDVCTVFRSFSFHILRILLLISLLSVSLAFRVL